MNFAEIIRCIDSGQVFRFDRAFYSEMEGICAVNGMVALPVELMVSIQSSSDIPVSDDAGQPLGLLCCCTHLGNAEISSLTDAKYAAYLNERPIVFANDSYEFTKNYFVVSADRYQEYKSKYMESAPLWGGFLHNSGVVLRDNYQYAPSVIVAVENIRLPTVHHKRISALSVVQPYAFERFLKLYHLLELLFDYDVVKEIQALQDNLDGIGKILANYNREELDRLKSLMMKRCNKDLGKIEQALNNIGRKPEYIAKGKEIFFKFSKDGNPLKDKDAIFDEIMRNGGFSLQGARAQNLLPSSRPYDKLIIDLAAYWIYRIRCCVAHTKIGEYVLVDDDEEFVCEVIEPIIREVLCQAFQT